MSEQPFRVGEWQVEPMLDQVTRGSETHRLEPRTMRVLVRLAQTPGKVVSSEELLDSAWKGVIVSPASVYQAISQLRKLLGDTDETPRYIATVPRRGYRLVAQVTASTSAAPAPAGDTGAAPPDPVSAARAPAPGPPDSRKRRTGLIAAALMIGGLVAIALWYATRVQDIPVSARLPQKPPAVEALAVMPFQTADQAQDGLAAKAMTHMLFDRLQAIRQMRLISPDAANSITSPVGDGRDVGRKLRARYLLSGNVARTGDRIRLTATLLDASRGGRLWSADFDRPLDEITAVREEIAANVADKMRIDPAVKSEAGKAPVKYAAYEIYAQAHELHVTGILANIQKAAVLFTRATTLDPRFARAYMRTGESLAYAGTKAPSPQWGEMPPTARASALRAYDRALELDPALGEARMLRASLITDPKEAESQFRIGMETASNYTVGIMFYANFLQQQGRTGEALELLDRSCEFDPHSPILVWLRNQLLLMNLGDVDGAIRRQQEALAIDPDFDPSKNELSAARWHYRGEAAQFIRLAESGNDLDTGTRAMLAEAYLDVDDLAAATQVRRSAPVPPPFDLPPVSIYRGDTHAAAQVAKQVIKNYKALYGRAARWLRDDAVVTGDFASAMSLVEPVYLEQQQTWTEQNADRSVAIIYAHLLLLSGRKAEGELLAKSLIDASLANEAGRPEGWFAGERAELFAMLGDDEHALAELESTQKLRLWSWWWYTSDHDPAFAHLHGNPRFRALADAARKQRREQRALLDEMRRKGEVPYRDLDKKA